MCGLVPSSGSGLNIMYTPESRHKPMKKLEDMLTLRGNRSQAKHMIPMRANTNPRTVRIMQRAWHRLKRCVGGWPWNGPTWTRCGFVENTNLSGSRWEVIRIRPGTGSVSCSTSHFWVRGGGPCRSTCSMPLKNIEVGDATNSLSLITFPSAFISSLSAILSLYRIRKKAPRKDIIAGVMEPVRVNENHEWKRSPTSVGMHY